MMDDTMAKAELAALLDRWVSLNVHTRDTLAAEIMSVLRRIGYHHVVLVQHNGAVEIAELDGRTLIPVADDIEVELPGDKA